jgi:hypothetical protein
MENKKKIILCDAKAFCFGPISKLLVVTENLRKKYKIIFLVSGTSKVLSGSNSADEIIECNTEDVDDLNKNKKYFLEADLFINIMNPISAKFATENGVPMTQIDSLFWMWENIPKEILDSDIYSIQNFDGVNDQLERYKNKIKNPVIVGPIIKNLKNKTVKKNKLVINLGGMESASIKIGVNTNYPFVIMGLLDKVLSKHNEFDEIVCCGNKKVLKDISDKLPNSKIKFKFYEHDSFLKQITEARMIISSPGLTTAFEAFDIKTPMFFLPPQNYSQYWNLDTFSKNKISADALNWDDLYPNSNIIKNEEQLLGIKKVLNCVNSFEDDKIAKEKVKNYIEKIIHLSDNKLQVIADKQKKYLDSLGGNGVNEIIKQIDTLMEKL